MSKREGQKQKLMLLARILEQETDEQHSLSLSAIQTKLRAYGVETERKSLYDDMEALRVLGYDIEMCGKGRASGYYLASRLFELPELKVLVDAVQASKFLPRQKTRRLIGKLQSLCSVHEARQLQRQVYVANRVKSLNESIYYSIDTLHDAMQRGLMVSFCYAEWGADGQLHLRHEGRRYFVSPYALLWQDENYYLLAYDSSSCEMRHYRVDKMMQLCCEPQRREGAKQFESMDIACYTRGMFGMFGGTPVSVTLCFESSLLGVILDRFGSELVLLPRSQGRWAVHLQLVPSPQFMGWLAGLGSGVLIEQPQELTQQFCNHCRALLAIYEAANAENTVDSASAQQYNEKSRK